MPEAIKPIHIISLGAGVQSSTMALMAAAGEITPMPLCSIFADTKREPESVYEWLRWLTAQLPFPNHIVSKFDLGAAMLNVRTSAKGNRYNKYSAPFFIFDGVKVGIMTRQCTEAAKIEVIYREIQRVREKRPVIQWIGISTDEASRMKDSRRAYCENRWPLIELGLSRSDCQAWLKEKGFGKAPRSACTFCPYHNDAEWLRLKTEEPKAFADAVQFEREYQAAIKTIPSVRGIPYAHRSCKPLSEIDFSKEPIEDRQLPLFVNECEGMCGV